MENRVSRTDHFNSNGPDSQAHDCESCSCWLHPEVDCHGELPSFFAAKLEYCLKCGDFRNAMDDKLLRLITDCLHAEQESGVDSINQDLTDGFFEALGMLIRLSRGDTSVRVPVDSGRKPFNVMKLLLNNLAENMQDIVNDSHEMAIGLCENYETLNRISTGDFTARSSTVSGNELVAKLGELINMEADALTSALSCAKKAEESQQTNLNFLRTLIDTIPSPIFYKDAACRYLGCNKAFEAYVGFSQDELVGKTPADLWPAELADRYLQQDLAMLENPGTQVYEATVRYADGTLREVIFNKATFEGNGGVVAGIVGVILDITERKAAEDAANNAYQHLSDIVEFLPDATFVVNKDKRVIAWNRAIEKMTGLKKEDVLGRGDLIYSVPFYGEPRSILIDLIDEDPDVVARDYTEVKIEGRTLSAEAFVPSFQNGGCRYFWGTAAPLFDKSGELVGGIESLRDITEYRLAEKEKSRLEAQLHHARLMETVVNRLGHDLKTPLTPLFIMLPLLKKRLVEPDMITKVEMCIQSTKSIKNLADKAAILARLSFTIEPYELEDVPLTSIVDKSFADCEDMIFRKEIECRNSVDPVVAVHVVPAQIRELLVNLISNAVAFSPEKSVVVISAERSDGALVVSVRDEGVGLDPAHINHVFDEFFKADESRHDLNANGLGLSICKRIVLGHHGRIWAESPGIGKGTTICFTLHEQSADYKNDDYSI